jgi:hypothetical protein
MDSFIENIENRILPGGKEIPFNIPADFWVNQEKQILSGLNTEVTYKLPHTLPFQVPEYYFSNLEEAILAGISDQEIVPSFPMGIGLPFQAPSKMDLEKAILPQEPKQVGINAVRKIWYYSAAASVAIAMVLGFLYSNPFGGNKSEVAEGLQEVSKDAVVEYLASMPVQNADIVDMTSDDHLNDVLDEISTEALAQPSEIELENYDLNIYADEIYIQ